MDPELRRLRAAVDIRRTFAIISHPAAGKTTLSEKLRTFERSESGARRAPMTETEMDDPMVAETIGETAKARMVEELALLESAGNPIELNVFRQGQVTPVFFGSAMNSFGVEPYLDRFVELAPPPRPRRTSTGTLAPDEPRFSGFVF